MQVFRWSRHSNHLECESDARASAVVASMGQIKPPSGRQETGMSFPKRQLGKSSLDATQDKTYCHMAVDWK